MDLRTLHDSQQMFASKYMLYLPKEDEVRKELAREPDQIEIRQTPAATSI